MDQSSKQRKEGRQRRQGARARKVSGTPERPRLSVFRSHRDIYAQIVDDSQGRTLLAAASRKLADEAPVPEGLGGKCAVAYRVGRPVAELAKEKGIGHDRLRPQRLPLSRTYRRAGPRGQGRRDPVLGREGKRGAGHR